MANYILLESIELGTSAASVTFANIPQTGYTDLQIVVSARSNRATEARDELQIRFNGDTAANYSTRELRTIDSGTPASITSASQAQIMRGGITAAGATANTFGSTSIYIPNYTSSNAKSVSIDFVTENNGTPGIQGLDAAIWTGTTAITSIFLKPEVSTFTTGSTFSLYGISALGTSPAIAPKALGGNIIVTDGTYWIHTFNASGTFTPLTTLSCDYLVVAGGGAGGRAAGAGGGAGGYRTSIGGSTLSFSAINYPVVVGAGGAPMTASRVPTLSNGSNSSISSITSTGGGGGGGYNNGTAVTNEMYQGASGGSGGGTWGNSGAGGVASPAGQGNAGGTAASGAGYGESSGGGGGAGGAGGNGQASNGICGNGGVGLSNSITGTAVFYAGGGGGGYGSYNYGGSQTAGSGGNGGGGAGGTGIGSSGTGTINGANGTANLGGGGGGGSYSGTLTTIGTAGAGGSGVVIIRYPV